MARQDFPVPLAPFGHGACSACGFASGRPRPPCGPANSAGPQWLYASRGSATADYAPSLRSPWRAARDETIIAKVWLIGRSYAAAIERRKKVGATPAGDRFYENTVVRAIKASPIDDWFEKLSNDRAGDIALSLKIHGKVTKLFSDISKMQKRSLASKYLHFHFPERFYIFDSRACGALANLVRPARKPRLAGSDSQYAAFFHRCELLNNDLQMLYGRRLNARELDKVLLTYAAKQRL